MLHLSRQKVQSQIVTQPRREITLWTVFLLIAGNHVRSIVHRMGKKIGVDATLDFQSKGKFKVKKSNKVKKLHVFILNKFLPHLIDPSIKYIFIIMLINQACATNI